MPVWSWDIEVWFQLKTAGLPNLHKPCYVKMAEQSQQYRQNLGTRTSPYLTHTLIILKCFCHHILHLSSWLMSLGTSEVRLPTSQNPAIVQLFPYRKQIPQSFTGGNWFDFTCKFPLLTLFQIVLPGYCNTFPLFTYCEILGWEFSML